jgi:hypothetical protein
MYDFRRSAIPLLLRPGHALCLNVQVACFFSLDFYISRCSFEFFLLGQGEKCSSACLCPSWHDVSCEC